MSDEASFFDPVQFPVNPVISQLQAEIERLRNYERECEKAADIVQLIHPIGQVKAIGLREVAAGVRWMKAEIERLRAENEHLKEMLVVRCGTSTLPVPNVTQVRVKVSDE